MLGSLKNFLESRNVHEVNYFYWVVIYSIKHQELQIQIAPTLIHSLSYKGKFTKSHYIFDGKLYATLLSEAVRCDRDIRLKK